jgi:hypothetical protein
MGNRLPATRRALLASVAIAVVAALAPVTTANADTGGAYQYPVRPGSAAWKALPTHDAMVRVTQLPAGLAATMPTDKLVSTALDYPLFRDAIAFNSVQHGIETVARRFNGLTELLRRPDSGAALLTRYRTLDVRVPASATTIEAGDHSYDVWAVETLLAQPQILATLSGKQLDAALRTARDKYTTKQAYPTVYSTAGLEPTAVLLGRALAVREGWNWRQSRLLRDALSPSATAVEEVRRAVDQHFADPGLDHPVGTGVGTQDYGSTVYTPRGTAVGVTTMTWELSDAQRRSNNDWVARNYPAASRETDSSRKYNCHSYAWYYQGTNNDRWMNTPGDDTYWNDGSYTRWHPPYIWFANMRYSWSNGDHSGIEDGTSGNVRSKWGQLARMYHRWDYSPYDRSVMNFYFR